MAFNQKKISFTINFQSNHLIQSLTRITNIDIWEDCLCTTRLHESVTLWSAICCAISQYHNIAKWNHHSYVNSAKAQKRTSQISQKRKIVNSAKGIRLTFLFSALCDLRPICLLYRLFGIAKSHFQFYKRYIPFCDGCAILFKEQFYCNLS